MTLLTTVKKLIGGDPIAEYRDLIVSIAGGEEPDQERVDAILDAVCRTEAHVKADVARYTRMQNAQQARQRLADAQAKLPAAQEKLRQEHATLTEKVLPLRAEYERKVRELSLPVDEARAAVRLLEEVVQESRIALSGGGPDDFRDPALLAEIHGIGERGQGLRNRMATLQHDIAVVAGYHEQLSTFRRAVSGQRLPAWYSPDRNAESSICHRGLTTAERASALRYIAKAESEAEGWKKELASIPEQFAELAEKAAELNRKAWEPEKWRLAEADDSDMQRLCPPEPVYQSTF